MSRAQIELSFHWIFVLLAGGVFLLIFFFAIKGCMDTGQERARTTDIKHAASTLSATAWQPRLNNTIIELSPLGVSCPQADAGGELVLSTPRTANAEPVREYLNGVPAFLPPSIGGRNRIITADVQLNTSTRLQPAPPIELGSVLYAINENTYYYVIDDGTSDLSKRVLAVLGPDKNIIVVNNRNPSSWPRVPEKAAGAIIVSFITPVAQAPARGSQSTPVRQVTIIPALSGQHKAEFRDWQGAAYTAAEVAQYQGDVLAAGAAIAGTRENYLCARTNAAKRMRSVTQVMELRRLELTTRLESAATGSRLKAQCAPLLGTDLQAYLNNQLNSQPETLAGDEAYLRALFAPDSILLGRQRVLFERGCPVIA